MMTPAVLLEAWGFTLMHFCWQAAALSGFYKLAELAMPRLGHSSRYVLALGTLMAIAATAVATFIYELIRLTPDASIPAAVVAPLALPMLGAGQGLTFQNLLPWIEAAWLLGVVALSCRTLAGLYMIHRLKKHAQAVPESVANRFAWALRRVGLTGKVRIRLHPHISGPFVIGAVRSIIYLPVSAVTALSPDQLDAVLAHELEHIRRADYAWNLVQNVIETLFFFHPAVWWLGGVLREQRELCCDDAALKACSDPLTYATALLSLEEQRRGAPRLAMALNGQGEGKSLMGRIARMLGEKSPMPRGKTRPHAALALPVILLVLAAFITPVAQVAASVAATEKATSATDEAICTIEAHHHTSPTPSHAQPTSAEDESWENHEEGDWEEIDPDAIAAEVRADLLAAQADIASAQQIDGDAIAAEVKADMERAKADMERSGIKNHGIDPEAIAAQVRADIARSRVDMAAARAIDVDALTEQARADAQRHKAEMQRHRSEMQRHRSEMQRQYKIVPPPVPDAPAEIPAALAGPEDIVSPPAPAAPPAPPSAPFVKVGKMKAVKAVKAVKPVKVDARRLVILAEPTTTATAPVVTLNKLPVATPALLPQPNVKTEVTVLVATTSAVTVAD